MCNAHTLAISLLHINKYYTRSHTHTHTSINIQKAYKQTTVNTLKSTQINPQNVHTPNNYSHTMHMHALTHTHTQLQRYCGVTCTVIRWLALPRLPNHCHQKPGWRTDTGPPLNSLSPT